MYTQTHTHIYNKFTNRIPHKNMLTKIFRNIFFKYFLLKIRLLNELNRTILISCSYSVWFSFIKFGKNRPILSRCSPFSDYISKPSAPLGQQVGWSGSVYPADEHGPGQARWQLKRSGTACWSVSMDQASPPRKLKFLLKKL